MWKIKGIHWFAVALIYIGFFGLIGVAVWITNSAMPLWALLLTPSFKDDEHEK
jgi:hypothetical protein